MPCGLGVAARLLAVPRLTDAETVIRSQVVLEEHDVSADGRFAVVVRRFVFGNRYRSHLWRVPLQGSGRPVQLTSGGVRDSSPRIAPDGSAVAFRRTLAPARLRDVTERASGANADTARLRILPFRGDGRPGKPWSIRTPPERSVGEIAWAPDGKRLALTLDVDPPRFIEGPQPRAGETVLARRVRRIDWRLDEVGFVDRWAHLHVVEARREAEPRQLTAGDWGVSGIAWAPDGRSIAFVADPRPDADLRPRTSIWAVEVDINERGDSRTQSREVLALGGAVSAPAWSPDGRWLAAVGIVEAGALDDVSPTLVIGPADGATPAVAVAPEFDRPFASWIDTDLFGWTASSRVTPSWLDAGTIVAVVSDRGRAAPWRFTIDARTGRAAAAPERLVDGDIATHTLAVAADQAARADSRVTLLACLGTRPMELVTVPLSGSRKPPIVRSRIGGSWATRLRWPEMHSHQARGPAGSIETWVASPAGAGHGPLPTIVDVHGGPLGAWAPAPHIEVVLLCAAGYRVILPNIRGSATYGRKWIRPQLGDWGGVDAADVHAAIDHVVELGLADPARLGAFGLSYGGFMVNWLVATSNRFRAAVSENGVANQVSSWAGSDTGVEYNRMSLLGAPLDKAGVERLWRQSPLAHVADVRTPLLLLQGGADQRCPPSDSEQLFVALRVLEREVEYVVYPDESHVYMASGRPDRRIDRMTRVIDWFDRYLRG
jgi:dipeptidyl aminopeptidase/acylaminoacyl peptidase